MASFPAFNALQQKQLFSINLCKCPSSLSFKSSYLISHVFTISTLKHNFHQDFPCLSTFKATFCSRSNTKQCSVEHKSSTETLNPTTQRDNSNGFSPSRSRGERVGRKDKISLVVEEKMGRKYRKDTYVRKDVEPGRKREMGPGITSLRSVDERVDRKSMGTKVRAVVDDNIATSSKKTTMDTRSNKTKTDNDVGEGENNKKKRRSRKVKVENPELELRVGFDMCSKKGDFLGAISLYDSAQRDGVSLGQYHYTVLLYLCSSAAVGVVRPAKSGSSNRSSDKEDLMNGIPKVDSLELDRTSDTDDGNFDVRLGSAASSDGFLVDSSERHGSSSVNSDFLEKNAIQYENNLFEKSTDENNKTSDGFMVLEDGVKGSAGGRSNKDHKIQVSEDVKKYALRRGFEIYERMCLEKIPLNEATLTSVARMAMSMGNGIMALEMVNMMKEMGINPRLRSYGPALFAFCNSGDVEKAFMVEEHMLENGVIPEESELEALLRLSVDAGRGDKVYYLLHQLRKSVRRVSPSTADLIERWFRSKPASVVGKRKWDAKLIMEAMENGGGGWHGQGWLGNGKWTTARTCIGTDGVCESCGDKLVTIDLDPTETENFAKSVASIAAKRERQSSFQNFQKWLDYYGPFEAVVDAANVGLFSQRKFSPSKVNAIVNGIRQKLPSKKWPLIVLHNKRVTGSKMDEPANKFLFEKWKNADALYATPTGSNDDWYWLYAAIKFKCLLVTNDEMRDHIFQLLGNDFFPRWKERHQVRFSFGDGGPEFNMPPPCSVVIQESDKGHWHIPIVSEDGSERERIWLCVTQSNQDRHESPKRHKEANRLNKEGNVRTEARSRKKLELSNNANGGEMQKNNKQLEGIYSNLKSIVSGSASPNYHHNLIADIEKAEKLGDCIIDFQI